MSAEIQANVSLRIAFRVRDRADSVDVSTTGRPPRSPPAPPGAALARGADGRLVAFQARSWRPLASGLAAGSGASGVELDCGPVVGADGGRAAGGQRAGRPTAGAGARDAAATVVAAVRAAHVLVGGRPPRTPWLPPLPRLVPSAVRPRLRAVRGRRRGARRRARPATGDTADLGGVRRVVAARGRRHAPVAPRPCGRSRSPRRLVTHRAGSTCTSSTPTARWPTSTCSLTSARGSGPTTAGDLPPSCATCVRRSTDGSTAGPVARPRRAARRGRRSWYSSTGGSRSVSHSRLRHRRPRRRAGAGAPRRSDAVGVVGAVAGGRGLLHPRWAGVGTIAHLLGRRRPARRGARRVAHRRPPA